MEKNTKKIIANASWMLFDKVFLLILNLLVTVQVVNYYGALDYGTYQYAVSVVAIFEVFVTLIDGRVIKKRYLNEKPEELVWNVTVSRLLFSSMAMVLGALFLYFGEEDSKFAVLFVILLVNVILSNLRFGMQNRYEFLLKSKKIVLASNIALIIGGVLQLIAVELQLPIVAIAVIIAFSSMISLTIVCIQYRREFGSLISGRIRPTLLKELARESLPLAVAASCSIIYQKCDSVMVGSMLSKADLGVYAIAVKLISITQIASGPICESVFPKMIDLYNTNREMYARKYVQVTAVLTWTYVLIVLVAFMILPYAFKILKPEYATAFPIYQVYVIGSFFMYNAGLRAGHYTLINRGSILMNSQIFTVVFNIILNIVFIKNFGVYGAALATALTQGATLFFSNLAFGKDGREVFMWQLKGINPVYIFNRV